MVLSIVAVVAIAGLGFFAFKAWVPGGAPAPQEVSRAAVASSSLERTTPAVWTKADNDLCIARARAAAQNPETGNYRITNHSVSEGVAALTSMVQCQLTTKVTRFCGAEGKAQLIALVNDYFSRMSMVTLGIGVQGAPMAVAGAVFGGEPAAGDAIYREMASDTLAFMKTHNARVVAALQTLGRNGVVRAEDFRSFPFADIPENIVLVFDGIHPAGDACIGP